MGTHPKHPDKDLRKTTDAADAKGWTVTRGSKYFMMKCPCPLKHKRTVKLSPSNPNYGRELVRWLERSTCSKEGEEP